MPPLGVAYPDLACPRSRYVSCSMQASFSRPSQPRTNPHRKGQHLAIRLLGLAILRLLHRLLRRLIRLPISVIRLVLGLLRRLYGRQLGALRQLLLLRW